MDQSLQPLFPVLLLLPFLWLLQLPLQLPLTIHMHRPLLIYAKTQLSPLKLMLLLLLCQYYPPLLPPEVRINLIFMSTIKCSQLWPNHFVTRLDASCPAYGDLEMVQFVCDYFDCIHQSPIQLQPLCSTICTP